eukprot:3701140-Pleurochrysis_carterae.AAC.1
MTAAAGIGTRGGGGRRTRGRICTQSFDESLRASARVRVASERFFTKHSFRQLSSEACEGCRLEAAAWFAEEKLGLKLGRICARAGARAGGRREGVAGQRGGAGGDVGERAREGDSERERARGLLRAGAIGACARAHTRAYLRAHTPMQVCLLESFSNRGDCVGVAPRGSHSSPLLENSCAAASLEAKAHLPLAMGATASAPDHRVFRSCHVNFALLHLCSLVKRRELDRAGSSGLTGARSLDFCFSLYVKLLQAICSANDGP